MRHGNVVKRPCATSKVTGKETFSGEIAHERMRWRPR